MDTPTTHPEMHKPRVMIVDDSPSMVEAAKGALEALYDVRTYASGIDALADMAGFNPDLVLLDIVMPGLDGYETIGIIRRNPAFTDLPVLMMSGKGSILDLARGTLLGFSGAIPKPFDPSALLDGVAKALAARGNRMVAA